MDGTTPPVDTARPEGPQKAPKRKLKLPPLVINVKNTPQEGKNKIIRDIKQNNKEVKIKYTPTTITVFAPTREILKSTQGLVAASRLECHTYTEDGAKDKKLVIKGLPPLETEEIIKSLQEQGVTPNKLVKLEHSKQNEHPIFYLSVSPESSMVEIINIRYICSIKVRWEKYRNPRKLTQCHRCHGMGHGSGNSHHKPKCVKGTHNDRVHQGTRPTSKMCKLCRAAHSKRTNV